MTLFHVRMGSLLLEELDQLGCMDRGLHLSQRPDAEVPVFSNSHVDMGFDQPRLTCHGWGGL